MAVVSWVSCGFVNLSQEYGHSAPIHCQSSMLLVAINIWRFWAIPHFLKPNTICCHDIVRPESVPSYIPMKVLSFTPPEARCLGDWSLRNSETIEAGQGAVGGGRRIDPNLSNLWWFLVLSTFFSWDGTISINHREISGFQPEMGVMSHDMQIRDEIWVPELGCSSSELSASKSWHMVKVLGLTLLIPCGW